MHTLHLVSHTHWDREWYLTFQQFRLKLVRLVDDLLDLLARDPDYAHFMLDGQAIVLEDYLAIRQQRFSELREHVLSGRLSIGPWYILPDEFLVSPEATIRNLLEGAQVCKAFGPIMPVGYIPDTFGHIGQMPQILNGFGIQDACVMRGLGEEPCEFWWQSPDGSRVLMAYLRDSYSNAASLFNVSTDNLPSEVFRLRDSLASHSQSRHLLLMHGTDHMPVYPGTSAGLAYLNANLNGEKVVHSTLAGYLAALRESFDLSGLQVVTGELRGSRRHPLLPGVLSTRGWIKQRNNACENLLEGWAEPFSTWAEHCCSTHLIQDPASVLRQSWRLLMQCHPHDSICGCSLDQVHEEMRPRFDQVEQIGEEITRQSLETLADSIATAPDAIEHATHAVIVFNPSGSLRTDLVTATLENLPEQGGFELVDDQGIPLPSQKVGLGSSELINLTLERNAFRESFRLVANGTIMNWKIQRVSVQRAGKQACIRTVVTENSPANLSEWERGRAEVASLLEDPQVLTYQVIVVSAEAAQVLFTAPQVPAHGYRTFWVRAKADEGQPSAQISPLARALMPLAARLAANPGAQRLLASVLSRTASYPRRPKLPAAIENEYFHVEAVADGTITVLDKRTGERFPGQNRFTSRGDRGDTYNYSAVPGDNDQAARLKIVRIERGLARQVLTLELELEIPASLAPDRKSRSLHLVKIPITSRITLASGVARVDFASQVDNQAKDHRLRVHFTAPFAPQPMEGLHDGHFEVVRRPAGIQPGELKWVEQPYAQVPQRAFTCISDEKTGLLLANRGLPEIEVAQSAGGSEIVLTLLRCVGWLSREDFPERMGHAGPYIATPGAQMQGHWSFDYGLIPFPATERLAAWEQARAFQLDMRAVVTPLHPGQWASTGSFLAASPAKFVISAIKKAVDDRGWLLRGYNVSSQPIQVRIQPMLPYHSAELCSLAEQPLAPLEPDAGRGVTVTANAHQVITVRFQ